ncbi:FixH family protein [Idiomarina seosinensis]|uniref:FixH family protein n=1 Tax=Idiomarina seosinensis TaxID=281739 RepID=UPI00384F5A3C
MVKPWYKQFWPWFLIAIPVLVMVVCAIIIYLSVTQGNFSMVVDDYYKRGKTINAEIADVKKAQELGINFQFKANDGKLALRYKSGAPEQLSALNVKFVHAADEAKDFSRRLTVGADGIYRADIPTNIKGKWTVTVKPFDNRWKVSQKYWLPTTEWTLIEPLLYGV